MFRLVRVFEISVSFDFPFLAWSIDFLSNSFSLVEKNYYKELIRLLDLIKKQHPLFGPMDLITEQDC